MPVYLKKINPEKNQYRFYSLSIAPTLFGEWALIHEWGRIGQGGTVRSQWFDTEAEAMNALEALKQKKEKNGYK